MMNEILSLSPVLYIPTFHGDVRLERVDGKQTRVIVAKATPLEAKALKEIAEYAVKKGWLEKTGDAVVDEGSFMLKTDIATVQKRLAKALKPGREVITVVRFAGGKMEEIVEAPTLDVGMPTTPSVGLGAPAMAARVDAPTPEKRPVAAATVSRPTQGCPAPNFAKAELRANRCLEVFLTDEQRSDFRAHNQFVAHGAATGHRYLITSRLSKNLAGGGVTAHPSFRTLYDLDDETPFCVHDFEVPPAEEMLTMLLCLAVPHHELFCRHLDAEAA